MAEPDSELLASLTGAIKNRGGGVDTVVSHWSKLLEGVQESPQAFYASVTDAVKKREIPGANISTVEWPEGGPGSAQRLYLRVERGHDVVDICGAPFGNAFFASSWLCLPPPNVLKAILVVIGGLFFGGALAYDGIDFVHGLFIVLDFLFILGVVALGIIRPLFFPPRPTFYRLDTANMFHTAVQAAVSDAVDQLTSSKGLRALTPEERKPIMRFMGAS